MAVAGACGRMTGRILPALIIALLTFVAARSGQAANATLTFLHFNDVYHYRPGPDGSGGLAQLSSLIRAERRRHPDALVTFGGDLLSPSLASSITKGAHMIGFLNGIGVDVAVAGNHEFDFGPKILAERIRQSRFPWLAADALGPDGKPCCGARAIWMRTVHGIKVGFFGIVTDDTATTSNATDVRFVPELATARDLVERLHAKGAQVVVALTHLPLSLDEKLARDVKGIDLILGGHDHYPVAIRLDGAPIVKAGANAQWLGIVRMAVRTHPHRPARVTLLSWGFVANRGQPADPALVPLVTRTDALVSSALDRPLATLTAPLRESAMAVRERETAIGDLFADILRKRMGADAALINGGAIRGDRHYPAGATLTLGDVHRELPFGNIAVLLDVTGGQLRAALENGLSETADHAGRFPQVSGLTLTWNPTAPPGHRLMAVSIDGAPLDPLRHYRLATTDFVAAGHDGYGVLRHVPRLTDPRNGPLLANVVAQALAAAGSIRPHTTGRIRCVDGAHQCGGEP